MTDLLEQARAAKAARDTQPAKPVRPPTQKQLDYLDSLLREAGHEAGIDTFDYPPHSAAACSELIDYWKPLAEAARAERRRLAEQAEPPEGIHYLGGVVYKVQVAVHGSGRKYVKRLDVIEEGTELGPGWVAEEASGSWEYIGRDHPFDVLSDGTLMTKEDAQEYGRLYGMCCVCGATLTDEQSIERGIGPICAKRF